MCKDQEQISVKSCYTIILKTYPRQSQMQNMCGSTHHDTQVIQKHQKEQATLTFSNPTQMDLKT